MSPSTFRRAVPHATRKTISHKRIRPADGGIIRPAIRSLLVSVAASVLVAAVVFLLASDGLGAWNGHVVSVRPSAEEDPATFRVLIVGSDGTSRERNWPADVVLPLELPVDALALPPAELPEAAAPTTKDRFALHFLVRKAETADWRIVPTTSPRALGLAVLAGAVLVLLRNMAISGSPFSIEPRGMWLPPALAKPGTPAAQRRRTSKQGPPEGRPRIGRGRR
jgi:hypothetical protein